MIKSLSLLLATSFIGFSLQAQAGDTLKNNAARPSTLQELAEIQKNVVKELDSLFETKESKQAELPEDLRSNLEQLHEAASEIKHQTGKLLHSYKHRTKSVWDSMFKEMEKSQKTFGKFFSDVRKGFKSRPASNQYRVHESVSDDGKAYGVSIALPDFSQDQIKVSIEEHQKNNRIINRLKISAQAEISKKTKSEINGKTTVTHTSHQTASSSYINGRQQYVNYKDGKFDAVIDLPRDIKPDTYSMTFEDGVLKIEFEKDDAPDTQSKKLEFKEKKHNSKQDK